MWLIEFKSFIGTFFLWGGLGDVFKFHLVKWLKICTSIKSGGLRVKNLIQFD
jgi:hypothetical protein